MKPLIYLIFIILAITTSCAMDYIVMAEICNETYDTVHLKLEYDTMYIMEKYSNYNKNDILKAPYADSGIIILKTDSTNYTKEFIIYPTCCLAVGGGNALPQMWYSKMTIFHGNDSSVFVGRDNIDKIFKKTDNNLFKYIIK
jgi:hypothetical protein